MNNFFKLDYRFRWVFCQLEALRGCYPQGLRRALDQLPETLDATYERTLLGIDKAKQRCAYHLFQCLSVSIRPLRVEELAEILAVLLDTGEDSEYNVDWRPEDAQQAVLSTCSSLITVVNVGGSSVVQFSHFSVKEFLTSSRLANAGEHLSHFHILPHSAHAILARALLSVLLNLGENVDKIAVENHPLAIYAARYWVEHANFEGVSSTIQDLMERLFDRGSPHFATWVWLYDIDRPWEGHMATSRPKRPMASPLYYAAQCGFRSLVEDLARTDPGDVKARGGSHSTPLHAALAKRDVNTALALLEHGADVNSLNYTGRSPLHAASMNGHCDVVEFLLEHQANVDIQQSDGSSRTPLHLATQIRDLEVCRVLRKYGADLDKRTEDSHTTPLHFASWYGNLEIAHFLIEQGANTKSKDLYGDIPLHYASLRGHLDLVEMFLEGGADIDARNADEKTPLDLASRDGHLQVARFLIERGANVNCWDKRGWTPLHSAARYGHLDVVRLLLDLGVEVEFRNGGHGADTNVQNADLWAPLHLASAHGHLTVAELLVDRGAEVDLRNEDQRTPLHLASQYGELEVARLLVKRGSNVNCQDNQGWTPTHSAASEGHLDVVKLLLDSGADMDRRDRNDKSAFDTALEYGNHSVGGFLARHEGDLGTGLGDFRGSTSLEAESQNSLPQIEVVEPQMDSSHDEDVADEEGTSLLDASWNGRIGEIKRLLDRGADVDERDQLIHTPLHLVSWNGMHEIAEILIGYGADVNSRDIYGWTPLHMAARYGHVNIAQLLLDNGADVNATQKDYETPLHIASMNEHFDIVQFFLERGANVQSRNASGRTPSQEASIRGDREIVQLLSEYGVGGA